MQRTLEPEQRVIAPSLAKDEFLVAAPSESLLAALIVSSIEWFIQGATATLEIETAAASQSVVTVLHRGTGRKLVFFPEHPTRTEVSSHLQSGAWSLVSVVASRDELSASLNSLVSGPRYVATSVVRALTVGASPGVHGSPAITRRESEVLELVRKGCSNAEIAAALFVSINTVRTHLQSLSQKFGVTSRSKLVAASSGGFAGLNPR